MLICVSLALPLSSVISQKQMLALCPCGPTFNGWHVKMEVAGGVQVSISAIVLRNRNVK